jgi:signal transduction histidine kinase
LVTFPRCNQQWKSANKFWTLKHLKAYILPLFFICKMTACSYQHQREEHGVLTIEQFDILFQEIDSLLHSNIQEAFLLIEWSKAYRNSLQLPQHQFLYAYYQLTYHRMLGNKDSVTYHYKKARQLAVGHQLNTNWLIGAYTLLLNEQGYVDDLKHYLDSLSLIYNPNFAENDQYTLALFYYYQRINDVEQADQLYAKLMQEAKETPRLLLNMSFLKAMASYAILKNDDLLADQFITDLQKVALDRSDLFMLAEANMLQAQRKKNSRQYVAAVENLLEAGKIYEDIGYKIGKSAVDRQLGNAYISLSQYDQAIKHLFDALTVSTLLDDRNNTVLTLRDLAYLYSLQAMYTKAEEYFVKAIDLADQLANQYLLGSVHNTYGIHYELQEKYEKAIFHYAVAHDLWNSISHESGIASTLYNQGMILRKIGSTDESLRLQLQSYELEKKLGNVLGMLISEYSLASFYLELNESKEAKKYLELAEVKANQLQLPAHLERVKKYYAAYYEQIGDDRKANQYLNEYLSFKERNFNAESLRSISEAEGLFKIQQKELELELLSKEQIAYESQLAYQSQVLISQRYLILAFILIVIVLSVILSSAYRILKLRKKSNDELKQMNEEIVSQQEEMRAQAERIEESKSEMERINATLNEEVERRITELTKVYNDLDTFFYKAAHDFRGPITTFMGLAEVAKSTTQDPTALMLFDKVNQTTLKLNRMVEKLSALSLITNQYGDINAIDFQSLVDNILKGKDELIRSRNVNVLCKIDYQGGFSGSKSLITMVLDNLIENAIVFSKSSDGTVQISVTQANNRAAIIQIVDNGDGIAPEFQDKVFDLYVRAHENSQGNGLGLYIVKRAMSVLNGKMELFSRLNKGTSFRLEIPNAFLPK